MLSSLRRPIVNIFSMLNHSTAFLDWIQLKFVNSEIVIKNSTQIILKTVKVSIVYLILFTRYRMKNFETSSLIIHFFNLECYRMKASILRHEPQVLQHPKPYISLPATIPMTIWLTNRHSSNSIIKQHFYEYENSISLRFERN